MQNKLQLLKNLFSTVRSELHQRRVCVSVLPGQQAVVSGVVVILEVDHIQLRVVILTGLRERTEVWMGIKYSLCGNDVLGMVDGPKGVVQN